MMRLSIFAITSAIVLSYSVANCCALTSEGRMGLIVTLIVFVALAAIIVWIADWASGARHYTALAALNRRLASGEIDRAEYDDARKLIGR
jgi:uncharacterized membrane protein